MKPEAPVTKTRFTRNPLATEVGEFGFVLCPSDLFSNQGLADTDERLAWSMNRERFATDGQETTAQATPRLRASAS